MPITPRGLVSPIAPGPGGMHPGPASGSVRPLLTRARLERRVPNSVVAVKKSTCADEFSPWLGTPPRHEVITSDAPQIVLYDANNRPLRRAVGFRVSD